MARRTKASFDKYVFAVPFATFDPDTELHVKLVEAGAKSEAIAAEVDLSGAGSFQTARKEVREVLTGDGVASEIEERAGELLEPVPLSPV